MMLFDPNALPPADLREAALHMARQRAQALENFAWRMIASGKYFSQGWRIVEVEAPLGTYTLTALAPDADAPPDCIVYGLPQ